MHDPMTGHLCQLGMTGRALRDQKPCPPDALILRGGRGASNARPDGWRWGSYADTLTMDYHIEWESSVMLKRHASTAYVDKSTVATSLKRHPPLPLHLRPFLPLHLQPYLHLLLHYRKLNVCHQPKLESIYLESRTPNCASSTTIATS